jgi:hypothetical protein
MLPAYSGSEAKYQNTRRHVSDESFLIFSAGLTLLPWNVAILCWISYVLLHVINMGDKLALIMIYE